MLVMPFNTLLAQVEGSDYGVLLRSKQAAAEAAAAAVADQGQGSLTRLVSDDDVKV